MKITAIKQQKKRDDRVSVFIDKKYSFSLSKVQLKEEELRVGQDIGEVRLNQLKQISEDGKLFDQLLGWLARRPRSIWETKSYLKRKEAPDEQIERFVTKLKQLRYLDDQSFAESFVRSRRLLKARSERKLRSELYQKGVANSIINQVLADDETDERDVLRQLLEKKRSQSRYQDRQKLIAYAARKGFDYDDIRAVVGELEDDSA